MQIRRAREFESGLRDEKLEEELYREELYRVVDQKRCLSLEKPERRLAAVQHVMAQRYMLTRNWSTHVQAQSLGLNGTAVCGKSGKPDVPSYGACCRTSTTWTRS